MVKTLNCYLYAKRVMALCLRVQFFLAIPIYSLAKMLPANLKNLKSITVKNINKL